MIFNFFQGGNTFFSLYSKWILFLCSFLYYTHISEVIYDEKLNMFLFWIARWKNSMKWLFFQVPLSLHSCCSVSHRTPIIRDYVKKKFVHFSMEFRFCNSKNDWWLQNYVCILCIFIFSRLIVEIMPLCTCCSEIRIFLHVQLEYKLERPP